MHLQKLEFLDLFEMVEALKIIEQDKIWHPEGNAFEHSIQCMEMAFKESNDPHMVITALFHDVGKIHGSIGHDKIGAEMLTGKIPNRCIWMIKHHIRFHRFLSGKLRKQQKVNYFLNHRYYKNIIMLSRWDRGGRVPDIKTQYNVDDIWYRLSKMMNNFNNKKLSNFG